MKDGTLLALASVAALAVTAVATRRGSRTTISGDGHSISLYSEPDLLTGSTYFHATFDGFKGAGWSAGHAVADAVKTKARIPHIGDDAEGAAEEERLDRYAGQAMTLLGENGWMNWVDESDFLRWLEVET